LSAHCAVIEAGPGAVRRLCCGTGMVADAEMARSALDAIDDTVALVDERPVSVDALWRAVLRELDCGRQETVVLVHPSWWATSRVDLVTTAAGILSDDVVTRPRSWLLAQAAPDRQATVVVEIAERLVVVTGAALVAEARRGDPHRIAEEVARVTEEMARGSTAAVLIDAPRAISGAASLATMIADGLRDIGADLQVLRIDDARLQRVAAVALCARDETDVREAAEGVRGTCVRRRKRLRAMLPVAGAAAAAALLGVGMGGRHSPSTPPEGIPTTFLVEGRIALTVPAHWPMQRVVAGPGSARIQVTSPSDPEVALHVTQSPVAGETLSAAAESLKRAIDAEPAGVFVDFNPAGRSAGRPAVTYRELRAGHHIRWTVLLDGAVRISIGCQSRPGGEDTVRDVCEEAVRSARALKRATS
jgi:type VII secretion-associated protein (TIGR03931 family)